MGNVAQSRKKNGVYFVQAIKETEWVWNIVERMALFVWKKRGDFSSVRQK